MRSMSSRAVPLVAAVETEVTEKAKRRTFTAEYNGGSLARRMRAASRESSARC
jgi:hypothetical protein